jgi:CheY-like chemotaxis protein
MDIKMPQMNGIEARKEIKKIAPDIPIITVTAYAFYEEERNLIESGFDDYIAKPFNFTKLIHVLSKFLK